jgi:hypothetical protein
MNRLFFLSLIAMSMLVVSALVSETQKQQPHPFLANLQKAKENDNHRLGNFDLCPFCVSIP